MLLRSACCLVVMLPAFLLVGCADSMPDGARLKRFTDLVRGYDDTLTRAEKEAAISELQNDKERQQKQLGQTEGAPKAN